MRSRPPSTPMPSWPEGDEVFGNFRGEMCKYDGAEESAVHGANAEGAELVGVVGVLVEGKEVVGGEDVDEVGRHASFNE